MADPVFGTLRLLVLPAGWLGCYALCRQLAARRRIDADWRLAIVLASVLWGALLAFVTELCSLVHALNRTSLTLIWLFLTAGLFWRVRSRRLAFGVDAKPPPEPGEKAAPPPDPDARTWLAGAALLLILLGAVALATPSTGWDSLTYHLPRVMHWIQNESVAHFPTSNTREIESAPWPAFAVAQTVLLCGSDRWANLVQWLALVFLAVATSLVAGRLGDLARSGGGAAADGAPAARPRTGTGRLAALTALLVVTLPGGALQAVTTYTDLVVSAWLLAAITLGLELVRDPGNRLYAWGLGGAVALGLLSKVTMVFYAAPFLALLVVWLWLRPGSRRRLPALALVVVGSTLALNLPHWARNHAVFGSPLGSDYMFRLQRNARLSLGGTASNAIRNVALHTATGVEPLTRTLNQGLLALHRLTGRDPSDPDLTFGSVKFQPAAGFPLADDHTGNPYHLALILGAVGTWLARKGTGRGWLLGYVGAAAAGALLFCACLRWQPWHTRLHLPWFFALLPVAAVVMVERWPRWLTRGIATGLFALALGCVLLNRSRPLLPPHFLRQPREQQYSLAVPRGYPDLVQLADDIVCSGAGGVGLVLRHDFRQDRDDLEYPYWVLLRNRGFGGRLDHVSVTNQTASLVGEPLRPDVVISKLDTPPKGLTATHPYRVDYSDNLVLYETQDASRWCRVLTLPPQGGPPREIPREAGTVAPTDGRFRLLARGGRPGWLHLSGCPRADPGQPMRHAQLYARTAAGLLLSQPNEGIPFAVDLPLPGGATAVTLALVDEGELLVTNLVLGEVQWSWRADNGPLPWARITRVSDPNASRPPPPGRSLFRVSAAQTEVHLEAGMDGTVELWLDVVFEAPVPPTEPVTLLTSVAGGPPERQSIPPGLNCLSLPVKAGTNTLSLRCEGGPPGSAAATIGLVVRSADLRFVADLSLDGPGAPQPPRPPVAE